MKRTFLAGVAVILLVSTFGSARLAAAQATDTSRGAAASPALEADQLILRVAAGSGYVVVYTAAGEPLEEEYYQVRSGEIQMENFQALPARFYGSHSVQDVYIFATNLTSNQILTAVTIETRVITFPDVDSAEAFVMDHFEYVVEQAAAIPEAAQDPEPIQDLPDHDEAIAGWTATQFYSTIDTGEGSFDVPGIRFVAQAGSSVASVNVLGTDASVDIALAETLLEAQLDCLRADAPCDPIPFPAGDGATPETGALRSGIRRSGR